jgi:hypothetical protein
MSFVYRYYDQAELERQLNARATVPDIALRYASESASARARLPSQLSISYGASQPERLDIFPLVTTGERASRPCGGPSISGVTLECVPHASSAIESVRLPTADIGRRGAHVVFVPRTDILLIVRLRSRLENQASSRIRA